MKEIYEQPEALRKTISPRIREGKIVLDDITLTPGADPEHPQGVHRGLRHGLPCGRGGQVCL